MAKTTIGTKPIHLLLTGLGDRAQSTLYALDEKTARAELAPLALMQLLEEADRPTQVLAMVTQRAREKTWPLFCTGVQERLGFDPKPVDIPDGRNAAEVRQIVEAVAAAIPEGADVTLDVTQGFRHFPFLLYAVSLYLQSLRGVRIRGAYYGMIEGTCGDEAKPIIDLRPLLELPEWFYAVRVFGETGSAKPMSKLLQNIPENIHGEAAVAGHDPQLHQQASGAERQLKTLERLAFAHDSALPLELGRAASEFVDECADRFPEVMGSALPFAAEIADNLREAVRPLQLASPPPKKGKWKAAVSLGWPELERQARLIDLYLSRQQFPLALGLMREWVISWCMQNDGISCGWLDHSRRKRFERRLGALAAFLNPQNRPEGAEPKPEQKASGGFWKQLSEELRNAFHHHGMREDAVAIPETTLEGVVAFWNELRAGKVALPALGGGGGRLLVTAQGARPGVLYSALKATAPTRCLVVCSPLSEATVEEAGARAGFELRSTKLIIQDAFNGFDEVGALVKQARGWLLDADEVVANLTGGTTLMGIAVQQLVEMAERLDRPSRRFALIDRRPPAEQEQDPYVASDCYWLDGESEGDADGDD